MTSVALVVLDTLRKDAFDDHFEWLPGLRFETAWSPSHYTVPAHASMFTGRYPSEIGVTAKSERLDCPRPVLPEQVRDAGISTRAISANLLASPINDFDRGFETFDLTGRAATLSDDVFAWQSEARKSSRNGLLRDAGLVARCLLDNSKTIESLKFGWRLRNGSFHSVAETDDAVRRSDVSDDEFLFVNLMDAHSPYEPPMAYRQAEYVQTAVEEDVQNPGKYTERNRLAYDGAVEYLSDRYETLFGELERKYDYVITVSDHGELFGEHGVTKHITGVFPELVHVPICISDGRGRTDFDRRPASLLDVHATVAGLFGIDVPSRGQNLLESHEGGTNYVAECHGLRTNQEERLRRKNVDETEIDRLDQSLRGVYLEDEETYVYESLEGTLQDERGARAEQFRQQFDEAAAPTRQQDVETETQDYTSDVEQQLSDLGYM